MRQAAAAAITAAAASRASATSAKAAVTDTSESSNNSERRVQDGGDRCECVRPGRRRSIPVCAVRTAAIDVSVRGQDGNDQSMTTTANGSEEVSDVKTRDQCSHDGSDEVKSTWTAKMGAEYHQGDAIL